jgi:ABC-type multidrug transport system ATPase subunit/ABC-type multidrug transport system permease subunit
VTPADTFPTVKERAEQSDAEASTADGPSGALTEHAVPPSERGFLLYGGRRLPIGSQGVTIGRGDDCDVMLSGARASRAHARVHVGDGAFWVTDLGSKHGTALNGEHFVDGTRRLTSGDAISIDEEIVRFISGDQTRVASRDAPVVDIQRIEFDGRRLTVGRDPGNDVTLEDPNVSRFHAEIVARGEGVELVDLGSRNGTRLDGVPVERAPLTTGSEIGIGAFALVFDGSAFVARDQRGALRLDSDAITVEVKDKQILAPTTLAIEPGEFVAVIGESGSGKSTLVKALAGVTAPTDGRITVSGEPLAARLTDIGYVPQDDIVHRDLTVVEALRYSARLRLPQDTSAEEIERAVARVLRELSLEEHADTRVGSLSGGQRKRVGVASELLNRPSLLFLDEPTSGLDPGLESRMMALLRELANESRAVAVVTHATKNLALCDKVVVMGRGGELTFCGDPAAALRFFAAEDFDGIYTALEERPSREWRRRFEAATDRGPAAEATAPAAAPPASRRNEGRSFLAQAQVLTGRYLKLLVRDRLNLAILLGQVPVLALANVGLFQSGLFDRPGGSPEDAAQLLFLLVIVTIWFGAIDAAREIVKERGVYEREAAIGVRLSAYLASKAIVLFGLVAVQTIVFAAIVLLIQPLDAPSSTYLGLLALLLLTAFVAVSMGLLISVVVHSEDQAMSFIPLAVIPQLLFAGAIVPVDKMSEPVQSISSVMFAQWSYASIGTSVDMNDRIAENAELARLDRFGSSFFDVSELTGALVLVGFMALFFASTALLLRRHSHA